LRGRFRRGTRRRRMGRYLPNSSSTRGFLVPYPLAGKVAPPRNEAETDGGRHPPTQALRASVTVPLRLDPKPSRHLPRRSSGGGVRTRSQAAEERGGDGCSPPGGEAEQGEYRRGTRRGGGTETVATTAFVDDAVRLRLDSKRSRHLARRSAGEE
jgi:hypothetical protein